MTAVRRPSLALVVTHFGPVPLWLPAFLLSCRHNPDVRWMIYTDMDAPSSVPANVVLRPLQLHEFNRRASEVLRTTIDVRPSYLRKLGDLKPTYGLVFEEDLRPFDFWAYSELDIVWGDIRQFLTDDLLWAHDVVSARHYKLCGHCTVFRNDARINRTFEIVPDAVRSMADPGYLRLDESQFTSELRGRMEQTPRPWLPRVHWERELTMSAKYQTALGDDDADRLWWKNGKTFLADGKELMYLHFHRLKTFMSTIDFGYEDTPSAFSVSRRGVLARG